ncbi:LysR family transcriptional regulator [Burkholderia lata]|uniref:LysR family transcriptional regulator n=2 Tax=Burkholderia cepacia complex TaxID=87882 RepID=A0ABY6Y4S0_9BURK|nr:MULTISPECIES: LysR family transcriptional regulator [Burkholderia]MCA8294259.1 LysR family transcriptional regulator [Burkholderia sp. AU30198]VWB69720.1 LysR family transcriptional regulator [Burkholderia lata]VWD14441.1 LysR family transcriptional regulator [Burkholderia aenigmatica]VWD43728.1 LysR family transcriptional regulator [Burkholderia aenigmatica]
MSKDRPDTYLNDRLDWNLLRTFLAIAREQSVSRAAMRLHLTQPAVSQALRRLEEQLGLRLVDRHGPRIEVTQAGIEVQQIAEDIYGTISRLSLADVDRDHDISGTVRIGIVSGIDFPAYDDFLAEFHRTYPRIEFESQVMRSADVVNSLQQRALTLGLTPRRALPKRIDARVFLRQHYALFCGRHHPLFGRDGLRTADLAGLPFVSFTGDKVGDHMSPLTIFRDEMGFTGRVIASSSSMAEVKRFIFAGLGIGCLPEHIVRDDIAHGRFQRLPPDEGVADVDIHFLWSQDRKLNAAEAAFVDALNAFLDRQEAPDAPAAP